MLGGYRGDVETSEPLPFGVWGEIVEPGRVGSATRLAGMTVLGLA